jgi:hypothetical protein
VSRPDRVIVTGSFADAESLSVGSPLTLVTPLGPRVVRVGGILSGGDMADAVGGRLILMDIRAAQFSWPDRGNSTASTSCRRVSGAGHSTTGSGMLAALAATWPAGYRPAFAWSPRRRGQPKPWSSWLPSRSISGW